MYIADPRQIPNDVFLYTLHPTRLAMLTDGATDAERAMAAEHWMYSIDLLRRGVVIFAGRTLATTPDTFASCVIRAASEDEARTIMEGDPAVKGGVFRAQLYRFQPMLMGEWPATSNTA
jgi:uncharacterized protein YciI